ncbi:MAG: glycoside hydrolase N-terminal domain-containing protein [Vicinamibacteria bacterium]
MKTHRLVLAPRPHALAASFLLVAGLASAGPEPAASTGPVLFYRQPATEWVEALPIGNGRLGGMVFGACRPSASSSTRTRSARRGPYDPVNPEALQYLPKVLQFIREGRYKDAQDPRGREADGPAAPPPGPISRSATRDRARRARNVRRLSARAGSRPRRRPRALPRREDDLHPRGLLERA